MKLHSVRRLLTSLLTIMTVMYAPLSPALGSLGFNDLNKRVERIEKQDAYKMSKQELAVEIGRLSDDVEEFIRDNPDNVDALVLSVRLGYVEEYFVKSISSDDNEILVDPETKFLQLHKRLDKAIAMFPGYAAAYYWKAALYGMTTATDDEKGGVQQKPINLAKALEFAQQAVKYDEQNEGYRQTLAIYHVINGDRKAALKVMDVPQMRSNPVKILLNDLETIPLPFGTEFSQQDTDRYIELLAEQKVIKNFPMLRVRAYVVPLSVEELTRFFQSQWPNFKFFKQGNRNDMFAQFMLLHAAGVRPSAHLGEARAWSSQQLGGIAMSVQEINNASGKQLKTTPGGHPLSSKLGDNFCYLFLSNHRVVN